MRKKQAEWTDRDQDIADARMCGDKAEAEVLTELKRLGITNDPMPLVCPDCGGELLESGGFAGETILFCKEHGICWTDEEGAIRNVY